MERFEDITPLMRPEQVEADEGACRAMAETVNAPPHIAGAIQDKGLMNKRYRSLKKKLDQQAPKPYEKEELDEAVKREDELADKIANGMLTQAEMRRCPSGATDRHRAWEDRHKHDILEWKNIRLRRHASGDLENVLPDASDIANIERLRPIGGAQEGNLDNGLIQGKVFHGLETASSVILSTDELRILQSHEPDLFKQVGLMTSDQREQVKELVAVIAETIAGQAEKKTAAA